MSHADDRAGPEHDHCPRRDRPTGTIPTWLIAGVVVLVALPVVFVAVFGVAFVAFKQAAPQPADPAAVGRTAETTGDPEPARSGDDGGPSRPPPKSGATPPPATAPKVALPDATREGVTWTVHDLARHVKARGVDCTAEVDEEFGRGFLKSPGGPSALVFRLDSAREALDVAYSNSPRPSSFTWGRFSVTGDQPLVDQVRAVLGSGPPPPRRPALPTDGQPDGRAGEFAMTAEEREVLDLVNAERKKAGKKPLAPSPELFLTARRHAANMAKKRELEHRLDGKDVGGRAWAAGYVFKSIGGVHVRGYVTPREVIEHWLRQTTPRMHLMADYPDAGVGVASSDDGEAYWNMVFGIPAPK